MRVARVLRRVWIPLVVLVVIGCGGFTVARVPDIFGSEKRRSDASTHIEGTEPFSPKHVTYEVFGSACLPWSVKITTTSPAVVGDIVSQRYSNRIGCRIVVGGQVKAEKVSNELNAFTHCLVEAT